MKYLKKFENHAQYETFIGGGGDTPFVRPNVSHCVQENEIHYNPYVHDYSQDYLTFVALEDGTFTLSSNAVSYSTDNGETWANLAANTASPTVTAGSKIMWKGTIRPRQYEGVGTFSSTGRFDVQGNVMSLLFGDNYKEQTNLTRNYAFSYLFHNNTNVVDAKSLSLPATTLSIYCYEKMFQGCTSLVTAPELPATTLNGWCYDFMFQGCTSLVNAPELPATTLAQYCYRDMFDACTSLTTAPELPATTLVNYCYQYMFKNCTNLVNAPDELPATTLTYGCYSEMFNGCTSLNSIKCLATDISASDCTTFWVNGVASSGTFVKAASMSSWTTGVNGIPNGWTVQTASE